MRTRYLFPHWTRYLGWLLVFVHIPILLIKKMLVDEHYTPGDTGFFTSDHLFFIATALFMAIGLFLVAFSKEHIEDEQISQLRLDSLQWAIYVNYGLLILTLIISNDRVHILFLNMWVPLAFFIVRFRWKIWQLNRLLKKEEV
ncbi:hypothetical protein [Mucilaginibacter sp.]|uniref:hypothetical protein n=1 Tax=Mucilaginibacter sp. TaxID=1882438 RepID=UPI0032633238